MNHILITTIAAVLLVGCGGPSAPDISIHEAAIDGNIEAVKQHLAAGVDVNAKMFDGKTPLDHAIKYNQSEIIDLLRKHGGKTGEELSIHQAAKGGNIEAVKQHLAAGADVNAKNDYGSTPLHSAAAFGHKEIAELLIAEGADVNAVGDLGRTPLDLAYAETADLLRKHGGKTGEELSIHQAAKGGNIEAVKQHLAAGADVNAKNDYVHFLIYGGTPLHSAARSGRNEITGLLIAKGADVNAKESGGATPLHWASISGHKEIIELLIAEGADVNAKTDVGYTPLDWNHPDTAKLLRKHGGKTGEELKAEGK
jgi:ankyrin repeat protein